MIATEGRLARRDIMLAERELLRSLVEHRCGATGGIVSRRMPPLSRSDGRPCRVWSARARSTPDGGIIELGGEIDVAAVAEFRGWLMTSRAAHTSPRLSVDLTAVSFLDVVGLNLLVELAVLTATRGAQFALIAAPASVRRLIRCAGLDGVLQLDTQADEAITTAGDEARGAVRDLRGAAQSVRG